MKYDYHIAILGAGSAGLTLATNAALFGAKVALIESDKMGGDCLNTGCVPSKAFLKCAHIAKDISRAKTYGITAQLEPVDIEAVMKWVKASIKKIEPHDSKSTMEKKGVDVFISKGKLINAHTININHKQITAKSIVISTGSSPIIPNIAGLNQVDYYTNLNIFDIKKLPKHIIILGGGMIGCELGQGFSHLGSKVTIIDKLPRLFTNEEKEASSLMEKVFIDERIILKLSAKILNVSKEDDKIAVNIERNGRQETILGDTMLVALGRTPNTNKIGLNEVGVKTNSKGFIVTDKKLRTSVKNIYAAGDVVGPYLLTNTAGYQAGVVLKNMLFHLNIKENYSQKAWTTYTKPEVAHVGLTEDEAIAKGIFNKSLVEDIKENDRAIVQGDTNGFIKLILNKKGVVIGATVVSENAGELLALASIYIKKKMKASSLMSIMFSYPTVTEMYLYSSLNLMQDSITPFYKRLLKMIFFR